MSVPPMTRTPDSLPDGRLKRAAIPAVCVFAFLLLFFVYRHYARVFYLGLSSDDANILLEAKSFLGGNPLLRGWYLTTFPAYTTDLIYYVLGGAIFGTDPTLLRDVPAFLFTASLAVAICLAGRRPGGKPFNLVGMITCFVLLGMPAPLASFNVLQGPTHAATVLPCLLALLALDQPEKRDASGQALPLSWLRTGLLTLLLTLAKFGDDLSLYVCILPIVLVSVVRLWRREGDWKTEARILGACAASIVLSKVALKVITMAGGFHIPANSYALHMTFTSFKSLPGNIWLLCSNLIQLYGAEFFDTAPGAHTAVTLAKGLGLCLVFYSLLKFIAIWRPHFLGRTTPRIEDSTSSDRIPAILALGMILTLTAYALSTKVIENQSARYLIPFVAMGAVLTGRFGSEISPSKNRFKQLIAIAGVAIFLSFALNLRLAPADVPATRLAAWLEQHDIHTGYGSYWPCSVTTTVSEGRVRLLGLQTRDDGALEPLLWGVDSNWYNQIGPVHCVVVDDEGEHGVSADAVKKALGPPASETRLDGFTILIWNQDITPLLHPAEPDKA